MPSKIRVRWGFSSRFTASQRAESSALSGAAVFGVALSGVAPSGVAVPRDAVPAPVANDAAAAPFAEDVASTADDVAALPAAGCPSAASFPGKTWGWRRMSLAATASITSETSKCSSPVCSCPIRAWKTTCSSTSPSSSTSSSRRRREGSSVSTASTTSYASSTR